MTSKALPLAVAILAAAAGVSSAQTAQQPVDPLTGAQNIFGAVVGNAFRAPDQIVAAVAPTAPAALEQPIGVPFRRSLEIPGAAFAALLAPFDPDVAAVKPAPAPTALVPLHPHHRRHHHVPT